MPSHRYEVAAACEDPVTRPHQGSAGSRGCDGGLVAHGDSNAEHLPRAVSPFKRRSYLERFRSTGRDDGDSGALDHPTGPRHGEEHEARWFEGPVSRIAAQEVECRIQSRGHQAAEETERRVGSLLDQQQVIFTRVLTDFEHRLSTALAKLDRRLAVVEDTCRNVEHTLHVELKTSKVEAEARQHRIEQLMAEKEALASRLANISAAFPSQRTASPVIDLNPTANRSSVPTRRYEAPALAAAPIAVSSTSAAPSSAPSAPGAVLSSQGQTALPVSPPVGPRAVKTPQRQPPAPPAPPLSSPTRETKGDVAARPLPSRTETERLFPGAPKVVD